MKTSDIVQLKRDIDNAIETAGRGEFRAFKLMEALDDLGYDIVRRELRPQAIVAAVEAAASIAEAVLEQASYQTEPLPKDGDHLFLND